MAKDDLIINSFLLNDMGENTVASMVAYFLAKYNDKAIKFLGYSNYSEAFTFIGEIIESKPTYIKLRRDEFDALLPESPRQGWNKRSATPIVKKFHAELQSLSFEELSLKVKQLIELCRRSSLNFDSVLKAEIAKYKEKDIEDIINFQDDTAKIKTVSRTLKERLLNYTLINELKLFYNYRCQICGKRHFDTYGVHVSEAHHIEPFVVSQNNNARNLIILCPDHHRVIHAASPFFDKKQQLFVYSNGYSELLTINDHL